jgi:hypothetical protein
VNAPPASPGAAPFALYLWAGEADVSERRALPFRLGWTAFPTPLSGGGGAATRLRAIWNNTLQARLGAPTQPSSPAPSIVVNRRNGTGRPVAFIVQGIIADPGSAGARPASVTNAVTVEAR